MSDLVVHAHSTYVQTIVTGGFFAVCGTCGWQAPNDRKTRAEAETDASNHAASTGLRWDAAAERFVPRGPA